MRLSIERDLLELTGMNLGFDPVFVEALKTVGGVRPIKFCILDEDIGSYLEGSIWERLPRSSGRILKNFFGEIGMSSVPRVALVLTKVHGPLDACSIFSKAFAVDALWGRSDRGFVTNFESMMEKAHQVQISCNLSPLPIFAGIRKRRIKYTLALH